MSLRIALVYDFDGTLSPQPMQEYTVLQQLQIPAAEFWKEVREIAKHNEEEPMLTYMRLIIEKAEQRQIHLSRELFYAMAKHIEYYPGVEEWFERITQFVHAHSQSTIQVDHYIISAGMKEILEGISIYSQFRHVYASEYHYNHHQTPTFPKQLITDTTKTQYLFRINKGRESLNDSINDHMPENQRPVPFANMIYIGDGMTDVPSMAVTLSNGGHAVAVYPPSEENSIEAQDGITTCRKLLQAGRVDYIAPADYRVNTLLERRVQLLLRSIIANIECGVEKNICYQENFL